MERWFTADTHFGQEMVIRLQPRPYKSLGEMEEDLVRRWNEVVRPGDIVYHLGDFAVGKAEDKARIKAIFERLEGEKMLVCGNHEKRNAFVRGLGWRWVGDIKDVKIDGVEIAMSHYPMLAWNGSMNGAWHLHGHTHGLQPQHPTWLKEDVGVDVHGLRPISFGELKEIMSKRNFMAPDKRQVFYAEDLPDPRLLGVTGTMFEAKIPEPTGMRLRENGELSPAERGDSVKPRKSVQSVPKILAALFSWAARRGA